MKNVILLSGLFIIMTTYSCKVETSSNNSSSENSLAQLDSIGTKEEEAHPDPFRDGEETTKHENGTIKTKGFYKNGKREGQWMSWYNNGKIWSESFFENGLKNGRTATYYNTGKLRYEGNFKNDKKSGTWKYYNESGKLVKEEDCGN